MSEDERDRSPPPSYQETIRSISWQVQSATHYSTPEITLTPQPPIVVLADQPYLPLPPTHPHAAIDHLIQQYQARVQQMSPTTSRESVDMNCPLCLERVSTLVTYETGRGTCCWVTCFILMGCLCFVVGALCFFWIPFCFDAFKDAVHRCPKCRVHLGTCKLKYGTDVTAEPLMNAGVITSTNSSFDC